MFVQYLVLWDFIVALAQYYLQTLVSQVNKVILEIIDNQISNTLI